MYSIARAICPTVKSLGRGTRGLNPFGVLRPDRDMGDVAANPYELSKALGFSVVTCLRNLRMAARVEGVWVVESQPPDRDSSGSPAFAQPPSPPLRILTSRNPTLLSNCATRALVPSSGQEQ